MNTATPSQLANAPIQEHATITVTEDQMAAFEAAFQSAPAIFLRGGALAVQLHRCIESPGTYLVIVHWKTVEDHTERFSSSPLMAEWREVVADFLTGTAPVVQHYETVLRTAA